MANTFPEPPVNFVGREEYIKRFRARLGHFNFCIYGGLQGIGKTALTTRLAAEAKSVGCSEYLYLHLYPGESVLSILARVEARYRKKGSTTTSLAEGQGDPFGRLVEQLDRNKVVLVLDGLQHLRRKDLPAMVRAFKQQPGTYRVLAATREDPDLSAMELMLVHVERVGPLTSQEVTDYLKKAKVRAALAELLTADAARGGCTGHPLTLRWLVNLFDKADDLPSEEFLAQQSSRSVMAFKTLLRQSAERVPAEERQALAGIASVGQAVAKPTASKVFGAAVNRALKAGMADVIGGDVYVHSMLAQVLESPPELTSAGAKAIAAHLHQRAVANNEPVGVIRAGEILARAGLYDVAVETLAEGWEAVRDLGFFEAYLKTLAGLGSATEDATLKSRLALLAARARMRQGRPRAVRAEMERLATAKDSWTKSRAQAALAIIYDDCHEPKKVVEAYAELKKGKAPPAVLATVGNLAAEAMAQLGDMAGAEKLAKSLMKSPGFKGDPGAEGELHRLLAKIYAQIGQLPEAVTEAIKAADAFEAQGDLYHAATAYGFIGDLYRETGEFEEARKAFERFRTLAGSWGERDLVQIAELSEAWVSLDIGDLAHAAKQIAAVEKEMSAAPSKRLRRYLAAASALLEAGRGHYAKAARALERVVESWDEAGQHATADVLRAHQVRALIASGDLEKASDIVQATLSRLDESSAAPRVASFLRESALIRLRRRDVKKAMAELAKASKLFSKGGNRREEVLTLYRIAYAALEQGDVALAKARAKEATVLAGRMKHARAMALAAEVSGRVALAENDGKTGAVLLKKALQSLRKLGDELGTLHVSEALLRAHVVAGDLAAAIRLGPKVVEHAEKLEIRDIWVRAVVYTGAALLRRGKVQQAQRCFRELPEGTVPRMTEALMWRLGEGLAALSGARAKALERRERWVNAVRHMPAEKQTMALQSLEQLVLPPRDQAELRTHVDTTLVGTEQTAWLHPADFMLFVDVHNRRIFNAGEQYEIKSKEHPEATKLFYELVIAGAEGLSHEQAYKIIAGEAFNGKATELTKRAKAEIKTLQSVFKGAKNIKFAVDKSTVKLVLPKTYAMVVPTTRAASDLSANQKRMLMLLRRLGTAPLQALQDETELSKAAARREVTELIDSGLVEAVRDGRGQAFRLL